MDNCEVKEIGKEDSGIRTEFSLKIKFEEETYAEDTLNDLKGYEIKCGRSSTCDLLRGIIKAISNQ